MLFNSEVFSMIFFIYCIFLILFFSTVHNITLYVCVFLNMKNKDTISIYRTGQDRTEQNRTGYILILIGQDRTGYILILISIEGRTCK